MGELIFRGGREALPSDMRRTARSVSRIQSSSEVRMARIDAEVEETISKTSGLTEATGSASADVVRLAQLHKQLELVAPEASGALSLLRDGHAFAMVDVLSDLRRDLRRR